MLRKAEDSGLFKFKKAERGEAICVAVTLLTCRHWRRAQTMKEMATIFNVPLKAINKAVKVKTWNCRSLVSVLPCFSRRVFRAKT